MRRSFLLANAIVMLAVSSGCGRHDAPVIVHVYRDPNSQFASDLRQVTLQFDLGKPRVSAGRPVLIATNEGDSFPKLMQRLKSEPPKILVLDSENEYPSDPAIRRMFNEPTLVCGGKPAYMLASVQGAEREATELYLRFLRDHCEQPPHQK